jgi:hypothetical protein
MDLPASTEIHVAHLVVVGISQLLVTWRVGRVAVGVVAEVSRIGVGETAGLGVIAVDQIDAARFVMHGSGRVFLVLGKIPHGVVDIGIAIRFVIIGVGRCHQHVSGLFLHRAMFFPGGISRYRGSYSKVRVFGIIWLWVNEERDR